MNSQEKTSQSRPPLEQGSPRARRYYKLLAGTAFLMVLSWVFNMLPLPFSLVSGLAALGALVCLILALIAAWPTANRNSTLLWCVLWVPASGFLLLYAFASALFYGPMHSYQNCLDSALTKTAESSCEQELPQAITDWITP